MTGPEKTRWPLTVKFVLGTLSGLMAISLVFLFLFTSVYRSMIESAHHDAAERVSTLLETSVMQAMLGRKLHELQPLINGLAAQPDVYSLWILNPHGEIRFSSDPEDFGRKLEADKDPGCRECHAGANDAPTTLLFRDSQGRDVLRAIKPVANRDACKDCHPSVQQQRINGVLVVDYDGSAIESQARKMAFMLVGAGLVVFIIMATGGAWFMRRFVLTPVNTLHDASRRMSKGELTTRVSIKGKDELHELGQCFNSMADRLQEQIGRLEEKDEFLQALLDAVPDGVRVIDESYRIVLANRAYRKQLNLGQDIPPATLCYESSHRRDSPCPTTLVRCPHHELMNDGSPFKSIHRHFRADGHHLDVEVYAAPMTIRVDGEERRLVVESIRDLKEQVRFSHEQKLSELGQLAAGVAHEIFNPLSAAKMKLDATLSGYTSGRIDKKQALEGLEVVDGEIARCMETADRLLKLSKYAGTTPTLVDVNKAVAETLSLLNHEAAADHIETRQHLSEVPLRTIVNESELRLVVLNLAQNAFNAMPNGGVLTVSTCTAEGWIQIVLEDNGMGIHEEHLAHIFEPFFSRRASDTSGGGAGLGLAISQSNIKRAGGLISVTSTVGEGSRFIISLPDPAERNAP